jgi:KUP system potassium uptake protein
MSSRAIFDDLGKLDGISHLSLYYGYHDMINIPKVLKAERNLSSEITFDTDEAAYFVSLSKIVTTKRHNMRAWQKAIYLLMSKNALNISDYYRLPVDRTEEMSALIKL